MTAQPALRDAHTADVDVDDDMARYEAAKAGARVSHARVRDWLLSKDEEQPLPRPEPSA